MLNINQIAQLLNECTREELIAVYHVLREKGLTIHPLEEKFNTTAEIILEAIARASDLSIRGVRGLIAEAAFDAEILPKLRGWRKVSFTGDRAYDFMIEDDRGPVTIQAKLQRQEKQQPLTGKDHRKAWAANMFVVETQKTRRGVDETSTEGTRPYRFGEFDILAVCMQPSIQRWDVFMYTVGNWLVPRTNKELIAVYQPVAPYPNEYWTDDLRTCIDWFRSGDKKTIPIADT